MSRSWLYSRLSTTILSKGLYLTYHAMPYNRSPVVPLCDAECIYASPPVRWSLRRIIIDASRPCLGTIWQCVYRIPQYCTFMSQPTDGMGKMIDYVSCCRNSEGYAADDRYYVLVLWILADLLCCYDDYHIRRRHPTTVVQLIVLVRLVDGVDG